MEVDGALVHRRVRAGALDESEQRAGRRVDDGERVGVGGTQGHARRRVVPAGPDPAVRRALQLGIGGGRGERLGAELRVALVERRLEGRRAHVAGEYARVRVVEDRRLDAPPEQLVRLPHEVLVERILRRDEHREPVPAAARAAPLLPQRRHRAGEADGDHRVEEADVDAELERVRGGHPEQVAAGEPPLDLAPLLRRVAGPVRREAGVVAEPLGREAVDQLGGLARLGERQRAQSALDELGLQLRRLGQGRATQAQFDVN